MSRSVTLLAGVAGLIATAARADFSLATFPNPTNKGPSTAVTPYIVPVAAGVRTVSLLTTPETVSSYIMAGKPDGLGAFALNATQMQVVMHHEFDATQGVTHAHGATGAFISKWTIDRNTGQVMSGADLITNVTTVNGTSQMRNFCSADLPPVSALSFGSLGTTERIFFGGEENDSTGIARGFAHIVTGPNAGKSFQLTGLGMAKFENLLVNPLSQAKTIVATNDDTSPGEVHVYVGNKQSTGSEIDKGGLTNGTLYGVRVTGVTSENRSFALSSSTLTTSAVFTLANLGSGAGYSSVSALQTADNNNSVMKFNRPEDGAWDPLNPADYYFATTDRFDQVKDNVGAQVGRSRLWRLRFNDITNPQTGGTITAVLDGSESGPGGIPGPNNLDNLCVIPGVDGRTRLLLQEDTGSETHAAKIWMYDVATDALTLIAKADSARFGDIGVPATSPFNTSEESSGIIDARDTLGLGWFLLDVQAHYSSGLPAGAVEGGQLLAMYAPQAVPEPGTMLLLAVVLTVLVRRPGKCHTN